jgi:uncharacterized protein
MKVRTPFRLIARFAPVCYALLSGILFAAGLVISGMTNPAKVIGFLNIIALKNGVTVTEAMQDMTDIASSQSAEAISTVVQRVSWQAEPGLWDPSLALVMLGALCVTLVAFNVVPKLGRKPWAADSFYLPTKTKLDIPLILGAALFGIGWGLAGYCPGPAIASLLTGGRDSLIFVATMIMGMVLAKAIPNR